MDLIVVLCVYSHREGHPYGSYCCTVCVWFTQLSINLVTNIQASFNREKRKKRERAWDWDTHHTMKEPLQYAVTI